MLLCNAALHFFSLKKLTLFFFFKVLDVLQGKRYYIIFLLLCLNQQNINEAACIYNESLYMFNWYNRISFLSTLHPFQLIKLI